MVDVLALWTRAPKFRRLLALGAGFFVIVAAALCWPYMRTTQHLVAARQAMREGELVAALVALEKAKAIQPDRAEVQYLLAVALRRAGRLQEYEAPLERAAELGWPEEDIRRQRLLAQAQRGDVPAVRAQLMALMTRGASDEVAEEIYEAMAKGYMISYALLDARLCLDFWLTWRPGTPQARVMRACIFEQTGEWDKAVADYRAALEHHPKHREARVRLGQAFLQLKDYAEAKAEFQARLADAPDDIEALQGLAQCERQLGDMDVAKACVERILAAELNPTQRGMAMAELGRILLNQGKTAEALEVLNRARELVPMDSMVHQALGTALARTGQTQKAQYHMDRFRHIRKQFDRMTGITRRLIDKPNSAELRYEAGAILMEQGMKKDAADWLLSALKCDPRHRKTHELLAEYYAELGDQQSAGFHRLMAAEAAKAEAAKVERVFAAKGATLAKGPTESKPSVSAKSSAPK